MMKQEFEALALRGDGRISGMLYDTIERFYMADNDYHAAHGGIDESKRDFVRRVFGGKVNTPKTVLAKITAEAIRENRYALLGCDVSKQRLEDMDAAITRHYAYLATVEW